MSFDPELGMSISKFFHDLGMLLLIDDIKDIGKFSFEGHPSPIHHWQIGYVLKELSLHAGQAISMIQAWEEAGKEMIEENVNGILRQMQKQEEAFKNILSSFPPPREYKH